MPSGKLKTLFSLAAALRNDLKKKKSNSVTASQLVSLQLPPSSPPTPKSTSPKRKSGLPLKRPSPSLSRLFQAAPPSKSSAGGSDSSSSSSDGSVHTLREILSLVVGGNSLESSLSPLSQSSCNGKSLKSTPDSALDLSWFTKVFPISPFQHNKEVSRERKQKWINLQSQSRRIKMLAKRCAEKLGTEDTLEILSKLGTGVKAHDAMVGICIEKAREADSEEEFMDQIHNAYRHLKLMREQGFPLSEESYGPCLNYLVDMEMEPEFNFFAKLIKDENPNSVARLGYYQMSLWIRVDNDDKIRELCSSVNVDGSEEGFDIAANYLLALCDNDREKELLELLEVTSVTKISSMAVAALFKSLGRLSLESKAVELLSALKKAIHSDDGIKDLSLLIFHYASNIPDLQVEEVVLKFKTLHANLEVQLSEITSEKLVAFCCGSLQVHAALDVVDYMHQCGLILSAEIYHPILHASEQSCNLDLVHPIYSAMCQHGLKLKGETIRSMISMHVKMKDFEGAYKMLQTMKEMGLEPTANIYNAIMLGYFREENRQCAMRVLQQMKCANVEPDSETYSYLIFNSKCEQDIVKYKEELECASVKLTKQIYMALIHAYANCGLFEKAKQVRLDEKVPGKNINEIKSALVSALASNGQVLDAMEVYKEMKQAALQIEPRAIMFLLDCLRPQGDLDKLLELLGELKDPSYWFEGCSRIIFYCIQQKNLRSAVDLLMQLKERDENSTRAFFDKLYCEISITEPVDMGFGLNFLQAMKEDLKILPSRTNLDFLLSACLCARDSHSAWLVWEEYQKAHLPYNILTYLRMYQVMLATGNERPAAEMLKKVKKDDPHVKYIVQRTRKIFSACTK